jgi:hypothetical protein
LSQGCATRSKGENSRNQCASHAFLLWKFLMLGKLAEEVLSS